MKSGRARTVSPATDSVPAARDITFSTRDRATSGAARVGDGPRRAEGVEVGEGLHRSARQAAQLAPFADDTDGDERGDGVAGRDVQQLDDGRLDPTDQGREGDPEALGMAGEDDVLHEG